MNSFRYQAVEDNGASVNGVIEAEDRKTALRLLGVRGLFPSSLETASATVEVAAAVGEAKKSWATNVRFGARIKRKEITAFTREMGTLLGAAIPIPQALDGLGDGEENPALREKIGRAHV